MDNLVLSMLNLDATTQKVVISMAAKNKAQRQEIQTTLQQVQSGNLLSLQQTKELLTTTSLSAKKQQALITLLAEQGILNSNTLARNANVQSIVQQLGATINLTKAEIQETTQSFANVAATNAQTTANLGLAGSFKALMASMGPIGWISLIISVLPMVISGLKALVEELEILPPTFEEATENLKNLLSEQDSVNTELETTQKRIAELEGMDKLSFTEEAELKRLRQLNEELKNRNIILSQQVDEDRKNQINAFNDNLKNKGQIVSKYLHGAEEGYSPNEEEKRYANRFVDPIESLRELTYAYKEAQESEDGYFKDRTYNGKLTASQIQEQIEWIYKSGRGTAISVQQAMKYLDELKNTGFDYNTADETTKANVDWIYEYMDAYRVAKGETEGLFSFIISRDKYSLANDAISQLTDMGDLTFESLLQLYQQTDEIGQNVKAFIDYMLSLGSVDWKDLLGNGKTFDNLDTTKDGIITMQEAFAGMENGTVDITKVMSLFAAELNKVEDASDSVANSIKTTTQSLTELGTIQDNLKTLGTALSEFGKKGIVSLDTLNEIGEAFKDVEGINDYIKEFMDQNRLK